LKVTAYVSHEDTSRHDTGWNHPDHQGRLPAVTRAVYRDMVALYDPLLQVQAAPAGETELLRVHTRRYVDDVRRTAIAAAAEGRPLELGGVPVSAATWDAALAAAGCAVTAVDVVMRGDTRNAFAPARPPGRGARADEPGEHSLFNNVAIAARHLRERHGSSRVLVLAWGIHPAAAIREVLAGDPAISVVSIHQQPDAGAEPHPHDRALPPGATGAEFADAMRDALDAVAPGDSPDFVLLSAGFDILAADPLGALSVSPADVHALTAALVEWAEARAGGRLASVLEGGSGPALGAAVVQHLRALTGLPPA
jgi:acetoin utilization deacetylase AcuC-like enzyme